MIIITYELSNVFSLSRFNSQGNASKPKVVSFFLANWLTLCTSHGNLDNATGVIIYRMPILTK